MGSINTNRFRGRWKRFRSRGRARWSRLLHGDPVVVDGLRDQLVGRYVLERPGNTRYELAWEVPECEDRTPAA